MEKHERATLTVAGLQAMLRDLPLDALVVTQFDVSDHDTLWKVYEVERASFENIGDVVILKAK